jgi:hypothetical protein
MLLCMFLTTSSMGWVSEMVPMIATVLSLFDHNSGFFPSVDDNYEVFRIVNERETPFQIHFKKRKCKDLLVSSFTTLQE